MTKPTERLEGSNPYAEWFEQLRSEYGEALQAMPLPDGLPEHLAELIRRDDQDAIEFMLKLAWQLGAQAGFAAGLRQSGGAGGVRQRSVPKVQA